MNSELKKALNEIWQSYKSYIKKNMLLWKNLQLQYMGKNILPLRQSGIKDAAWLL